MVCTKCGVNFSNDDKFCSKCGNKISENIENQKIEQVNEIITPDSESLSFNGIRKMNWIISFLFTAGLLFALIQTSKSPVGIFSIFLFYLVIISAPLTSAIALGENDFLMFGVYFSVDKARRKKLLKIALVLNWTILVFGCVGIAVSFFSEQLGPALAMLMYVIPVYLTIQAIRTVRLQNK